MFKALSTKEPAQTVSLTIEGETIQSRAHISVALAMLEAGFAHTRTTPVSGARRAPFCLMGTCFECLVEIDGRGNVQGCMLAVQSGMCVRRQQGPSAVALIEAQPRREPRDE